MISVTANQEFARLGDPQGQRREEMANHPNRNKADGKERAVVVTTQHRGVFFGYWSRGVRGFMGLAATGPDKESRVGPAADIEVRNITSVIECTPEAITAWEGAPWSR